ncbi:putative septum site determining protein [Mycobacterium intracellulare 1956]|uniref:Putative septum site determining protein n=1 Tax=Mycobacterium intracellulare 1956 TaxID=1299331 RepID=X8CNJ4_MYCIT|nr:putative septum site determining protein [Mycobacterium intracellulare 1956]
MRLRLDRRQQRQARDLGDLDRAQSARRRAPHHQADVGIAGGQDRRHRGGRRARTHVTAADDHDQIGGAQGGLGRVGEAAGQVADHGDRPATAGLDDGVHRPGVHLVPAPRSGQHADAAVSRQRIAHRRPGEPPTPQRQVRPAQARRVFATEQQFDAATPRVEVHQQRIGGGLSKGDRERRGAGPAAASDDGHGVAARPVVARRLGGFGERTNQGGRLPGQSQHVLGADAHGGRPRRRLGLAHRQHGHVIAAWQRPALAPRGRPRVQHDGRRRRPGLATHRRRVAGMHQPHPGRGRHPLHLGAQFGLRQHRQHTRVMGALCSGSASHPPTVQRPNLAHQSQTRIWG